MRTELKTVGFLSDEQKLQHLMKISGYNEQVYRHRAMVKIYEGAEVLLYHFDSSGSLIFDTVLVCSGFLFNDRTMEATFIDRKQFKVFTVRDIPNRVAYLDLLTSMPVRCMIERTMKITKSGNMISGSVAAILVQSKSNPEERVAGHHQAIALTKAKKYFSRLEFSQAENRAAGSN